MQAFLHVSNCLDDLLKIKALIFNSKGLKCEITINAFSITFENSQNFTGKHKRIFEYMNRYRQYFLMRR